MLKNSNLNMYKLFYYVVKNKSFTKAADELNMSQPNISSMIKQLESELNIKLLNRNKRFFEVTKEGMELYYVLEELFRNFEDYKNNILKKSGCERGVINIGIRSHLAKFFLLDYIKKVVEQYPNVQINIHCKRTSTLVKMLKNREIDFFIDTWPIDLESLENVVVKKIMSLQCTFISAKKHSEIRKLDDLGEIPIIHTGAESIPVRELLKIAQEKNINFKTVLTTNSTEVLLNAVQMNIGVGYVFKETAQKYISRGLIYDLNLDENLPKLNMNLVYMKSTSNRFVKYIIDLILNDIEMI